MKGVKKQIICCSKPIVILGSKIASRLPPFSKTQTLISYLTFNLSNQICICATSRYVTWANERYVSNLNNINPGLWQVCGTFWCNWNSDFLIGTLLTLVSQMLTMLCIKQTSVSTSVSYMIVLNLQLGYHRCSTIVINRSDTTM